MGSRLAGLLVCFSLLIAFAPTEAEQLACPAVDAEGKGPPLTPSAIPDVTRKEDKWIQADLAEKAIEIVGRFEAGGGDPWSNISDHERLSIGFMQWNWATGSLIRDFFAALSREAITIAPEELRIELEKLKDYADNQSSAERKQQATAVIDSWTKARSGDPLQVGVRTSVRVALKDWLNTPALRKVQSGLMNTQLKEAFALARAWRRDTAVDGAQKAIDVRLVAYFFDLITFNGGPGALGFARA